jgi:hypothetical protein
MCVQSNILINITKMTFIRLVVHVCRQIFRWCELVNFSKSTIELCRRASINVLDAMLTMNHCQNACDDMDEVKTMNTMSSSMYHDNVIVRVRCTFVEHETLSWHANMICRHRHNNKCHWSWTWSITVFDTTSSLLSTARTIDMTMIVTINYVHDFHWYQLKIDSTIEDSTQQVQSVLLFLFLFRVCVCVCCCFHCIRTVRQRQ